MDLKFLKELVLPVQDITPEKPKESRRLYQAAETSNYRPRRGGAYSGDATMQATGDRLRQLARYLDENHDLVIGTLDDLINNIIGQGLMPQPMVRRRDGSLHESFNKQIQEKYQEWAEKPDASGQYSMIELDTLTARTWLRDGETFIHRIRSSDYPYPGRTRLALECLEPDFCPFTELKPNREGQIGRVIQGIEIDRWRRPLAYYFYNEHPADVLLPDSRISIDTMRIDALFVDHLKFTRRLGQLRGVSVLHGVLNRLRDLSDYEQSEQIAAKVAAELTAYIKRNSEFEGDVDNSQRIMQMESGAIFELDVGEDVGTIQSDRPNTALADFRNAMMRAVAAGTGTRYSSISRDYGGTYSSQRQELVEASIAYRRLFKVFVEQRKRPEYLDFLDATPMSIPFDVDRNTLSRVEYRPPALPWIDPIKEAQAWQILIENKIESRAEISRQRGRDPRALYEELDAESQLELFTPSNPVIDDSDMNDDDEGESERSFKVVK